MSGKIGNLRYNHFFGLDDTIPFECSRDKKSLTRLNSDSNAENKPEVEIPLKGFSTLKLWFDSWKALGVWSAISTDPKILDRKKKGDALLLVGPIIGAPTNINEGKTIAIPILLEADRKTKIKISITNNFTNEKVKLVYDLPARAPVVVVLKPLELHTRYNIDIYKGLKSSSMNSFVLSTHFHWDESNIGVLNCEPLTETMSSADFCMDIINRWRVPFNGLTAFVHTNCQPNISGIVNGMKYSSHLIASLQESKLKRLVDEDLRTQLMEILDTLRDYFRNNFAMPSYREVLRNAYNLFIQNIYPIVLVGDSMYNKNSMKQGTEGTAKYDEDENETEDIDNSDLVRLLGLMVARLNQEYYERLQNPNVNVYRAIYYGDFEELTAGNDFGNSDSVLFESSSLGQAPELTKAAESFEKYLADDQAVQELPNSGNYNYFFCHTGMKAIDAVILQWQRNMLPAPAIWTPWVAPNGKASVEQMRTINQKNMPGIAEQFEQSPIDSGVRILILVDEPNGSAADELLKMNTMISREYQEQVLEWQNQRPDRKLCIVCPSSKFGTKTIDIGVDLLPPVISREGLAMDGKDIDQNDAEATETPIDEENKANEDNRDVSSNEVVKPEAPKEASLKVHFVDSIYRSNEYVRKQLLAEIEKKKAKKKVSALAAKTKRAQQKREEEERARQAEIAGEIQSVMESQIPDGYLIVQCRTYKLTVDDSEIHVTLTRTHLLGTVIGDDEQQEAVFKDIQNGMPTYFDFLQLPEWVIRFSPVTDNDTIFVQDEVLLFMRQQGVTKAALDLVEEGKYLPTVRNIYERSRLSELSRPPDLREVDMDAPGVITLFMNDVIDRIWLEAVPPSIQPVVFTLNDAFIRSYCLYKTMGDVSVLSSSASFAKAFQRSLVLGVAFKMAYEMSRMESYENILDSDDLPTIKLKKKLIIEEKLADEALVKEVKRKLREYEEKVAAEAGIILPPEEEEEKKKGSGDNEEPGANVEDAPTRENHLGYESDLEELDKEVKEMEEEERKAEEEESVGEDDDELENVKVDDNFAEEERKLQEQRELALQEIDRKQRTEEVAQENSEESIKKALIARNELAADVLNKTVENVLEIQLVEAVTLLAQLLEEERLQTALAEAKAQKSDSDRANSSTVFMLRMQEERILYRRLYGKRISFLG